jgi:hypothetical protein
MSEYHKAGRRGHGDSYRPGYSKLPANVPVSPRQLQAGLSKLRPEGICEGCDRRIERRSPMGPMPKRCPGCAADRKALRDRLRKRGLLPGNKPRVHPVLPRDLRPPCCRESGKVTCDQHIQARQKNYDDALEESRQKRDAPMVDQLFEIFGAQGFSIRTSDF